MQLQIPESELSNYKALALIPLKCKQCQIIFHRPKSQILAVIKGFTRHHYDFCSNKCHGKYKIIRDRTNVQCLNCNTFFIKRNSAIRKSPNNFCSQSCFGFYNNRHKKVGFNRSKFETFFEEILKKEYPTLDIKFNDRKTIGYELDIFIPSKQLAIEINGIFHYKPIYKNYQRTVEIDQLKQKLCKENNIDLYVFDISKLRHFHSEKATIYLNQIKSIINGRPEEISTLTHISATGFKAVMSGDSITGR